jgi:RimJ/RimL family protein N-acetyltransferase
VIPTRFTLPLETERLTLRLLDPRDAGAVHAWQSREDVCRYLLYSPRSLGEVRERIAQRAFSTRLEADGDALQLAIVRRRDGVVVGELHLVVGCWDLGSAELGWILHPDHQGQGYATEGARALREFAFETLGAHRVVARLDPENGKSACVAERVGMRHEAHLRQDQRIQGRWADTVIYGMLADDPR